jgi:hypothetical protein
MNEENSTPNSVESEDWDIDLSDVETDNEEEPVDDEIADEGAGDAADADQQDAEQPEDDKNEEAAAEEKPKEGQEKADQLFDLKFLGETKQVGRDEVIVLAQKGLNHDRMRTERDEAIAEKSRLSAYEDFLKEMSTTQNMSVDDFIDRTRAQILAEKEGIDQTLALGRVRLARQEKALEAERKKLQKAQSQQSQQDEATEKRRQDIMSFTQEYPDVDAKTIPKEVWESVGKGEALVSAYARYESKKLRTELDTLKQNAKNKERSTGSRKTAGKDTDTVDKFLEGWNSV